MARWLMARRRVAAAGLFATLALLAPASALACAVDGRPSLSANGTLVRIYTVRPTRSTLARWAPFVVPGTLPPRAAIRFSEDLPSLRRALPAQAFDRPWRWSFGDGGTATGANAAHTYARTGDYRVVVQAYYGQYKSWFQFDAALVHIGD